MANISISEYPYEVTVTNTPMPVTVSDSGTVIGTINVSDTTVNVTSTPTEVTVIEGTTTPNQIRGLFSADFPLLYDTANGVFSIDEAALFSGKTTDDLTEGTTNLYYSNTRVLNYIVDNGLDFNAEKVDDQVAQLMQTSGNLTFTYNDVANTLTLSQSLTTDDISEGTTNLYLNGAGTTTDLTEGDNLYYTDARADARVDLQTGANLDLSQKTTTDLAEGDNLYYTNQRVRDELQDPDRGVALDINTQTELVIGTQLPRGSVTTGELAAHEVVADFVRGKAAVTAGVQPTTGLSPLLGLSLNIQRDTETQINVVNVGLNNRNPAKMYYQVSDDKWYLQNPSNISSPIPVLTDDLAEGFNNKYFTTERARASVSASGDLTYNAESGVFSVTTYNSTDFDADFATKTTTDLTEGANLYYTDARVDNWISTNSITVGGDATLAGNVITLNAGTSPSDVSIQVDTADGVYPRTAMPVTVNGGVDSVDTVEFKFGGSSANLAPVAGDASNTPYISTASAVIPPCSWTPNGPPWLPEGCEFTVSFWYKPRYIDGAPGIDNKQVILQQGTGVNRFQVYHDLLDDSIKLTLAWINSTAITYNLANYISGLPTQWNHFAFGTDRDRFYMWTNGILNIFDQDTAQLRINDQPLFIGANPDNLNNNQAHGWIDELWVENRSPQDVFGAIADFPVPTSAPTNTDTTLLLTHFDLDTSVANRGYYWDDVGNITLTPQLRWNDTTNTWQASSNGYEFANITQDFDNQQLSFNPGTAELSISGGNTVDLSSLDNPLVTSVNGQIGDVVLTTTELTEGDNLYYTQARFDTAFSNKTTTDLTEGDNLYYTDTRANAAIDNRVTDTFVEALGVDAAFIDFAPNGLFPANITTVQAAIDDLQLHKLNVSALTSSVSFFPTTAVSDVPGYFKQVTSTSDPDYNTTAVNVGTGAITGTGVLIASLAGDPGELEGNTTPINITTIGNVRKTLGGESQNARFYFEVYKRDAGGSETLIGTSNETAEVESAIYEQFSATALIADTEFTATDRVVTKFYGDNYGGGAPEYDFEFGGATPVRTLFPVPVSVVPVDHSASEVTVDTTQFNGILSAADDTVLKALRTIDDVTLNDITGNAITGVNSITTETGSNFTINTDDSGMVVTQPFKSETVATGVVQGEGYAVFGQGVSGELPIVYTGAELLSDYQIGSNITQGSNVIDVYYVFNRVTNQVGSVSDLRPGMALFASGFRAFPQFTYVVAVDTVNNTVTLNNTASNTVSGDLGRMEDALVDTSTGLVIRIATVDGVNIVDYSVKPGVHGYPRTGPVLADFDLSSKGSDYTLPDFTPVTVAKTTVTPVKGVINSPMGLTIGENTALTNRGELDPFTSFGVNVMWDGTQDVFDGVDATVVPQMLFKSYTDGTLAENSPSNNGPRMFFSSAYGNANNNEFDTYPRAGQELGRLAFWGTSGDFTGDSSVRPPAYFSVQAGNDWTSRSNKQTDVFMGANPGAFHDQTDLFLSYQAGRLRLAGSDATSPIQFQPAIRTAFNAPQNTYRDTDALWATVNYANVDAQSGADFTVTNGGSTGAGVVGDMQIGIQRVDNAGSVTVTINITAWGNGQTIKDLQDIAGAPVNNYDVSADSITLIQNAGSADLLPNGTAVTINNATGDPDSAGINTGTYYTYYQANTGDYFYTLYTDAGLTTEATYTGAWTGGYAGDGFIPYETSWGGDYTYTYAVESGVTAKEYSFVLEEQSNDLKILIDGALHSTIKANGEIHDATGSKYITEADFSTLLAAQLPDQLRANQALIQELATGPVTPDFDGGTASTSSFDYTVDGGDAATTSFADAYEGGNAAGNSIVEGGFAGTTVYGSTVDGGDSSTTTFDQTIDGGAS